MNLKLELSIDEINKILTGLDYFKREIESVSQKIIQSSQAQIDEYNKKIEEENKQKEEEKKK